MLQEIALTKLHFAMNEQATSSKESIVELERDNSLLQQERAELTELLEELSKEITQLKSAQSKVRTCCYFSKTHLSSLGDRRRNIDHTSYKVS